MALTHEGKMNVLLQHKMRYETNIYSQELLIKIAKDVMDPQEAIDTLTDILQKQKQALTVINNEIDNISSKKETEVK